MSAPAELRLTPPNVCPTCLQKIKAARRRICALCLQPILRGHKFVFDGPSVRHCNCAKPTERVEGLPR